MRLAERWQLEWPLLAAAAIALVVTAVPHRTPRAPAPVPAVATHVSHRPACPSFARAQLHVDDAAMLTCLHGRFGTTGYFLHAFYRTSEWWERSMIVSDDGTVIVAAEDMPSRRILADGDIAGFALEPGPEGDRIWLTTRNSVDIVTPDAGAFMHHTQPMTGPGLDDLELVAGALVEAR